MTESQAGAGEAAIRALLAERTESIRAKDVAAALAGYAPDVLSYDLIDPLRHHGREAIRQRLESWLSSFRDGPIGFDMLDLAVTAGDDVAFSHSLNHVDATTTDGRTVDMFWRATTCFRRLGGRWMVTHEHSSVPFDMQSGQASLDLKP
jgi:uncharacterized protein (TIGR02246 family)